MATLTTQVYEILTLNGVDVGSSYINTITGINYADNRSMSLPSGSRTGIANFAANPGAGTFSTGSFKYGRFTNVGSVPFKLQISSSTSNASFLVTTGSSFILSSTNITGSIDNSFVMDNITNIFAEPSGSTGGLEYFIATT
jgi:hypothetical protein